MKLKYLLSIFLFIPLLCSCNNEDDIDEIFISGTWNVGNFYNGGDWHRVNDGARPVYTKEEDFKALNVMTVTFLEDGTIQGKLNVGTFTANWQADGKGRTLSIQKVALANN